MNYIYLVIERQYLPALVSAVNSRMHENWRPKGGVSVFRKHGVVHYAQAIYKPKEITYNNKDVVLVDMEATLRRN